MKLKTVMCGIAAAAVVAVVAVAPAGALSPSVVYDNIPTPQPGNVASEAFEAQSASEFGGQVQLAGTERSNATVTVLMSSWGCQSGHWYSGDCITAPGATFSEPVTLNIYAVGTGGAVGTLITSVSQPFNIPYRPSASVSCTDANAGKWSDGTTCFNGYAVPISFAIPSNITLPDRLIVSVAYNTTHYGASPYGEATACYASAAGCGYDSLNVGLNAPPTTGTDPQADDAYLNSSWSGAYCSGATGTFRLDSGCWTGFQPAFRISATPVPVGPPTNKDQCKNGGWQQFNNPAFKNQGDCVSFAQH